jgi:flavin reductase (DIM6/NTAB) family NADH-FMN oxidoreductase RutF
MVDAVAHLHCELEQQHLAGDHWIAVGRVRHLAFYREDATP